MTLVEITTIAGFVVGWHLPQPFWASWLQSKIVGWFKSATGGTTPPSA